MLQPRQDLKNWLAEFVREIVKDPNVAPMNSWRHRLKIGGMGAASQPCPRSDPGPRPRTAAKGHGEVTISTIAATIERLPCVTV